MPLVVALFFSLALSTRGETDEPMRPRGGLSSVRAFDVRIHLVYRSHQPDHQVDAESEWSGTVTRIVEGLCGWNGPMHVQASARQVLTHRGSHVDTWSGSGQGSDEQPFDLTFYDDNTYEFGFGHAEVPGRQTLQCSRGTCECDPEIVLGYSRPLNVRLPIPKGATALTGSRTFDASWDNRGDGPIPASDRFEVTWSFTPVGPAPKLKAVPQARASVERGEVVTLEGSASTGRITDYKWTFQPGNPGAERHGATTQVVLLDTTTVTLAVTDGKKTDSRKLQVKVVPRKAFRTSCQHHPEEGTMPNSDRPKCRAAGKDAAGDPVYEGGWTGGENVCARDPEASAHILHPNPVSAGQDDMYTLARVQDPDGPWDGYWWFQDWKLGIERKSLLNGFILPESPPLFPGMTQNFWAVNVERRLDVAGYVAAVRRHELQHTERIQKALPKLDPARETEKAFGKDARKLKDEADIRILEAAYQLHQAAKDPLPEIWHGNLAVPQVDTYEWRVFMQHVGGKYTIDF